MTQYNTLNVLLSNSLLKMTQYNTLNVLLPNLLLNKLKSEIKNGTGVTFNLLSNVVNFLKMKLIFHINYC